MNPNPLEMKNNTCGNTSCGCAVDLSTSLFNRDAKSRNQDSGESRAYPPKPALYAVGAFLFVLGILLPLQGMMEWLVFAAAYLLWGSDVLVKAGRNIARGSLGRIFDEYFLMSAATLGAFAIGEFPEGVAVMMFYQVGEMLQGHAVDRSRRSIQKLMDIRPEYARLIIEGGTRQMEPGGVHVGDAIAVFPGERIPLDGRVLEGSSVLDVSALTGESLPREVSWNDRVLSGSINRTGLLKIQVTTSYRDSTVSRILSLVEEADNRKAQTERFITRFARYYTPAVVGAALLVALLPPLLLADQAFSTWVYRALVFLVISCPCALVISIPLGFYGGIGGASRKGILVKGGHFLEALSRVETVIFDKTGTLTRGTYRVDEIYPAPGFDEKELLRYGAWAAGFSSHPVSASILRAWSDGSDGEEAGENGDIHFEETPGRGVMLETQQGEILMGNEKFLAEQGISFPQEQDSGMQTRVHLAVYGRYAGSMSISDEIKEDALSAVARLRRAGVQEVVMLTGDKKTIADAIGEKLGLDHVFAELLPHEKVEKIEALEGRQGRKGKMAFVGDGINDAPALARAEIGVAMGGVGSDAAIEAADVVLMTGEPSKLVEAISVARKTRRIVLQNLVFALGAKGLILLLGVAGIATLWGAVFADVGVALLAVLNALRAMR